MTDPWDERYIHLHEWLIFYGKLVGNFFHHTWILFGNVIPAIGVVSLFIAC